MKAASRSLLLAAALAVLLVLLLSLAVRFVARPEADSSARLEREQVALPFRPGEAVALLIAPRGAPEVRLEGAAAAGLLEGLSRVRVRARLPDDPAVRASRGLEPPAARVAVELGGGRSLVLEVGAENPYDRSRFGRRDGEVLVLVGMPDGLLDPARDPAR